MTGMNHATCIALAATFLKFLHNPFWSHFHDPGGYDRYFYLNRLVVVWSVALLVLDFRPRSILGVAAALKSPPTAHFGSKIPFLSCPGRKRRDAMIREKRCALSSIP